MPLARYRLFHRNRVYGDNRIANVLGSLVASRCFMLAATFASNSSSHRPDP